jgi:hypothetical protein
MSDAIKIYNDNLGNSHATAVNAVYGAGYADGYGAGFAAASVTPAQAAVVETVAETPNPELAP